MKEAGVDNGDDGEDGEGDDGVDVEEGGHNGC